MEYYFPFIEKINLLETQLFNKLNYSILEPFSFDSSNPLEVQKAGKKIAAHLGLNSLTFLISYVSQKENVGGHIMLDNSNEVYVEIDTNYKNNSDIVLYVLVHEICHKFLYAHNISLTPVLENEILTDLTTLYTGLGKLTLNGCEHISVKTYGDKTETITNKLGYISKDDFQFMYAMISKMNSIDNIKLLENLKIDIKNEIALLISNEREFFDVDYSDNDLAWSNYNSFIKEEIKETQKKIAQFEKQIREIEENVVKQSKLKVKEYHHFLNTLFDTSKKILNSSAHKKSHRFIKNLYGVQKIVNSKKCIDDKTEFLADFKDFINDVAIKSYKQNDSQSIDYLNKFKCPICSQEMSIPGSKFARVNCRSCTYVFLIDSSSTLENEKNKSFSKNIIGKIGGLFSKK
jgi:hypothetical protein